MAVQTNKRGSIIIRVVLLLFGVRMIYYLGSLIKDYNSLQSELAATIASRDELTLEVAEKAKLLETGNDADFIEKAAREKLGFVYSNEHVYIDISGE